MLIRSLIFRRSMSGLSLVLYTFSITSGTAMMMSGWISEKAFMMIFGLGTRLRKCTCMPQVIS